MSNYPDFISETGYGTGAGLAGWNCRHSFSPFIEGVSQPVYSKEDLEALDKRNEETKTYTTTWGTSRRDPNNPDRWLYKKGDKRVMELTYRDQLDMQRKMETEMRDTRRTAAGHKAAGLANEYRIEKARYYTQRNEYKAFSREMGIDTQLHRVTLDMLGRI